MTIDGEVLVPRHQLLVVPYAIRAETANTAASAQSANTAASATTAASAATATAADSATIASALAANGTNCPAGQVARGVDASGAAEDCIAALQSVGADAAPTLGGDLDAASHGITNSGNIIGATLSPTVAAFDIGANEPTGIGW
jgi:hypothetical protein